MQRVCWVEDTVPSDPRLLARVLRLDEAEVQQYFTPGVRTFFEENDGDTTRLRSLELKRQMDNIKVIRAKQSIGGHIGAAMTNESKTSEKGNPPHSRLGTRTGQLVSLPTTAPAGRPTSPELNRGEENREEQKQSSRDHHSLLSPEQAEFVVEMTEAEASVSKGRGG
jgi:hypothetical protein